MLISVDGVSTTIQAVTMAQMHQHCTNLQIDLFEFAAAFSLFSQANGGG
jgi:hypothetical protein